MLRDEVWREPIQGTRATRVPIIADGWHQALLATGPPARPAAMVHQQLTALTQCVSELLLAEPLDQQAAWAVGAALVELGFQEAAALGQTQRVLGQRLVEDLPAEQIASLLPRLTALLSAIAVGFIERREAQALATQEEARRAVLAAQHEVEDARREAEARLHLVVEHAPIIVFAFGREGVITRCEGHGLARLGYRQGELVGRSVWEGVTTNSQLPDALHRALAGEAFSTRSCVRGAIFETYYAPRREQGQVVEVIGVATDITGRVQAEAVVRCVELGLTPTEQRVLPLLARTDLTTYRQIGKRLHLEPETVRSHAKAIAAKLGVPAERWSLVAAARENGCLPPV